MPLIPEEPQICEGVPSPRAAPSAGRTAQVPRPVPAPGPRPAQAAAPRPGAPRPGPPRGGAGRTAPPGPGRRGAGRVAPGPRPGGDAAQIRLIPATATTAVDVADETVDMLLDSGRAPSEILVLTTGEPHPWQQHELTFGEESYWRQLEEGGDVFYAQAAAERAARRAVVVLAVNGGSDEAAAQALPAALSRAGAELIVCGDPERLRTLL